MLANYYFMTGRFRSACSLLEQALVENPASQEIRKKLVLCYLANNEVEKSYHLFLTLVRLDPSIIIGSSKITGCPCAEILDAFESEASCQLEESWYLKARAMLWLYRDKTQSVRLFKKVKALNRDDTDVDEILNILSSAD